MRYELFDAITGCLFFFGVGIWIVSLLVKAIQGVSRAVHHMTEGNTHAKITLDEMYGYAATRADRQWRDHHDHP